MDLLDHLSVEMEVREVYGYGTFSGFSSTMPSAFCLSSGVACGRPSLSFAVPPVTANMARAPVSPEK